jgi:tetratricopeptide (TPR) repeat protein
VLHSGYDSSEEGQARKRERDWPLLEKDLLESPEHPFYNFNYGMTAHFCGMHEKAIEYLRRSVGFARPGESHIRKAFALMGVSYRSLGDLDKALETFEEGLRTVGEDPELRFQGGNVLRSLGRLQEAKEWYLMVRENPGCFSSYERAILGHGLYFNLGAICLELGEYRDGRDWLLKAIEANPSDPTYSEALAGAALGHEDLRTAREAIEAIGRIEGRSDRWAALSARFAELRGDDPIGFLYGTLEVEPGSKGVRLELCRRLLNSGRERLARPHLELLDQANVAEATYFLSVLASRAGQYEHALDLMRRASELNPLHEETRKQLETLEQIVGKPGG